MSWFSSASHASHPASSSLRPLLLCLEKKTTLVLLPFLPFLPFLSFHHHSQLQSCASHTIPSWHVACVVDAPSAKNIRNICCGATCIRSQGGGGQQQQQQQACTQRSAWHREGRGNQALPKTADREWIQIPSNTAAHILIAAVPLHTRMCVWPLTTKAEAAGWTAKDVQG